MGVTLQPPDTHYLSAAEGWLGLGNCKEAEAELEKVSSALRGDPEVLRVRFQLLAAQKKWEPAAEAALTLCSLMPDAAFGRIQYAYALHELKRTREAYAVLLPIADRFPKEHIIRYNLACYSCQLGELNEARLWLQKAMAIGGAEEIKKLALADPDLQGLWSELRES